MIDCLLTAVVGAYPAKLYEFPTTKWVTMVNWAAGVHWVSMNKKAFNELPKICRIPSCRRCTSCSRLSRLPMIIIIISNVQDDGRVWSQDEIHGPPPR